MKALSSSAPRLASGLNLLIIPGLCTDSPVKTDFCRSPRTRSSAYNRRFISLSPAASSSHADDCRVVADSFCFINDESGGAQRASSAHTPHRAFIRFQQEARSRTDAAPPAALSLMKPLNLPFFPGTITQKTSRVNARRRPRAANLCAGDLCRRETLKKSLQCQRTAHSSR